jgi:hypothetical protein
LWTEFYEECHALLETFVGDLSHYARFSDRCLDMDPVGMTMALHNADCSVCGDGKISYEGEEHCDDGAGNSDEPGASCRSNCQLARCGDYIIDPNEDCDPPSEESNCDEKCKHVATCPSATITVVVGYSTSARKDVQVENLELGQYTCPSTVNKDNWLGGHVYGDTFTVTQDGDTVSVVRIDVSQSWGQDLKFECTCG